MTLDEPVEEYLETHHAEPVTVANLRWMLGKPRTALAETRPERSPMAYGWRLTVPNRHRFKAAWGALAGAEPAVA
jgi:hypothetical protein